MHTTNLMIEAIELRRSFKKKEALAGVSLDVGQGEIFGLLGPNDAGKTTKIRILTGQIDANSGQATVAGCDVARDRSRLKERIGVVAGDFSLGAAPSIRGFSGNLRSCRSQLTWNIRSNYDSDDTMGISHQNIRGGLARRER